MDRNTRRVEGQSDVRDMIVTHLSPEISRCPATACRRQNDRPSIPRAHNDRRPVPAPKAPLLLLPRGPKIGAHHRHNIFSLNSGKLNIQQPQLCVKSRMDSYRGLES